MARKGLDQSAYEKVPGNQYKPYVPAEKSLPEFTLLSIVIGILMAVVFGAANAYLGLKVGMTVSASVPAAVISMGIVRGILKRNSILENNMVQTICSAGESLAAGVIFTIPALILWGLQPSIFKMFLIALLGGLIGVLFMIPLRRHLIVGEHGKLPYPEGTACAEVLVAGERGGTGAKTVFTGLGIGALYKFLADGLKLWPTEIEWGLPGLKKAYVGIDVLPALLGVGYIIGPRIAAMMMAGGIMGWLVFIPLIATLGNGLAQPFYPAPVAISELSHSDIWHYYIRYIGAGAVALGGIVSLIKALPTIWSSFKDAIGGLAAGQNHKNIRTFDDLPLKWVIALLAVIFIVIAVSPQLPIGPLGAFFVLIFGFFFVTVSSRIVGIVGSSSNPASGMTIATLLFTTILLKILGWTGESGMVASLSIGALVCIAICIAGDTSQDLKTGFLVGATPKKQQIGELIGVLVSSLVIGSTLILLHNAYTIGSQDLAAPQATLMSLVVEGIMKGTLPWALVLTGVFTALIIEMFGIGSLPFAVGLYLPIHLSTPIIIGGLIRGLLEKIEKDETLLNAKRETGILYASGLIAGDALVGVIIAIFASMGISLAIDDKIHFGAPGAIVFFSLLIVSMLLYSLWSKRKNDGNTDVSI